LKSAFENCVDLATVTLAAPDSSIRDSAFAGCTSLKTLGITGSVVNGKVVIPDTVTTIAADAFKGSGIAKLDLTFDGTQVYNKAAFASCADLKELTVAGASFPASVDLGIPSITSLIWNATTFPAGISFTTSTSLQKLIIPTGLGLITTVIPGAAFGTINSFTDLEINSTQNQVFWDLPDTVTKVTIGDNITVVAGTSNVKVFNPAVKIIYFAGAINNASDFFGPIDDPEGLSGLTVSINVPLTSVLTSIIPATSAGNNKIETLVLRSGVPGTMVADSVLNRLTGLKKYVLEGNTNYRVVGEVLLSADGKTLIQYPYKKADTSYEIPSGVDVIGTVAFNGQREITELIIPVGVTSIGATNFTAAWTNLTTIKYNARSATNAEKFPPNVDKVEIGSTVVKIPGTFLGDNGKVESITIPYGVRVIEDGNDCLRGAALKTVYFDADLDPASPTTGIFQGPSPAGATSITAVYFGDKVTSIQDRMFARCGAISSINLNKVKSIGAESFYECLLLNSVSIPGSVTSIGRAAFANCTQLGSVTFANTAVAITADPSGDDSIDAFPVGGADIWLNNSLLTTYGAGTYVSDGKTDGSGVGWEKR
jgi:hypothetical protein